MGFGEVDEGDEGHHVIFDAGIVAAGDDEAGVGEGC